MESALRQIPKASKCPKFDDDSVQNKASSKPTVASRRVPDALRERIRDLVDVGEEVVGVDHLRARGVVQRGDVVEVVREVLHLLELDVLVEAVGAHLRRRRPRRRALDHLRLGLREFLESESK